jgi:hypothetical protein
MVRTRNPIMLVAILIAGVFAASTMQARLGWTLAQSVETYGSYKSALENVPGYLPGTVYGFLDKTADLDHPQLDYVIESFLDGKVGMITYANSDQTPLKAEAIQAALIQNAPEAEWSVKDKYFVGKVSGEIKYFGELHDQLLIIGTGEYFDALNAAKKAGSATAIAPNAVVASTPSDSVPTKVVSAITSNHWTSDALIVSGTLTNTSTVTVLITGIDAKGFNQDKKMVIQGSDFTVVHNDLAPGQVVNFKVALKDGTKQVKFVKLEPSWSP